MELINNILYKKRLHTEWKVSGDLNIYIEFKKVRAICTKLSRTYRSFYIGNSIYLQPSTFWRYFKTLNKNTVFPDVMYYGNKKANGP